MNVNEEYIPHIIGYTVLLSVSLGAHALFIALRLQVHTKSGKI